MKGALLECPTEYLAPEKIYITCEYFIHTTESPKWDTLVAATRAKIRAYAARAANYTLSNLASCHSFANYTRKD